MVFVRIVVLIFLTFYSYSMGQLPAHELNGFGQFVAMLFFIAAPALYLLPTYEAWTNDQKNLVSISLVNILLGWTLVGWVTALVWACKSHDAQVAEIDIATAPSPTPTIERDTKTCPFCAEEVLSAAIKCKHCGSSLVSQQTST